MSAPAHISRENGKKGGRPPKSKNKKTLEKEKVMAAMRQRIMQLADHLLDYQLTLARGQTFLYRIDKEKRGKGKDVFYVNKKPELVTNQAEIAAYIENETTEGDSEDNQDPAASYYFITAVPPNNQAIDSMLDRTFGKSKQGDLDVTVKLPKPLLDNVRNNKRNRENSESQQTD